MDQETAKKLFEQGAVLIFLDVPIGTEFGIDFCSWNTGEKFMGIKMIPPGIHFIYYSAVSKEGSTAPRTGLFRMFKKQEMLVWKWDAAAEDIVESDSEEEKCRLKANLKNLDKNLGPYPFENWKQWVSLSSRISSHVIHEIEPASGKIVSVADLVACEKKESREPASPAKRIRKKDLESSLLPEMCARPGTCLNFTKIPEISFPEGSSASDMTRCSIDTSYLLGELISRWEKPEELLGELQVAFVCFLVGQVYEAFEHWKNLVHIICSADDMLLKNPPFFIWFIEDLFFQMKEVPSDFFIDIISSENFLVRTLRIFFDNVLNNSIIDEQLRKRCTQFKGYVTERFQWDFDNEPEDEAPVYVEGVDTAEY